MMQWSRIWSIPNALSTRAGCECIATPQSSPLMASALTIRSLGQPCCERGRGQPSTLFVRMFHGALSSCLREDSSGVTPKEKEGNKGSIDAPSSL